VHERSLLLCIMVYALLPTLHEDITKATDGGCNCNCCCGAAVTTACHDCMWFVSTFFLNSPDISKCMNC
jgi:hypothetical protein